VTGQYTRTFSLCTLSVASEAGTEEIAKNIEFLILKEI
jgi:hypothetical protein